MSYKRKYLLAFVDEDWDHVPLGYTRKRMLVALWRKAGEKGIDVILVNRPFCLVSGWFSRQAVIDKLGTFARTSEGLKIVYPWGLHERLLALCSWLKYPAVKNIKRALKKEQLGEPVSYIVFHPYQEYLLNMFPDAGKIYECYDDYTAIKNPSSNAKLFDLEVSLLKNCDIVVTTSEELKRDRLAYRSNIACLPNGVDYDMFSGSSLINQELSGKEIKIGFVGKLNSKVDFELLNAAARMRPDWRFYMLGPWDERRESVPGAMASFALKNIVYTGPIQYEELPQWINGFNVAIIPYRCNEKTHGIFPLKYYEYLAAGKPVVSTKFTDFGGDGNVYLSDSGPEGFVEIIEEAMSKDDLTQREKRKEAAWRHSWEKRAEKLLAMLKDLT
jgi:teichuronic acid biosynthesis glycosyltransferase TuaH